LRIKTQRKVEWESECGGKDKGNGINDRKWNLKKGKKLSNRKFGIKVYFYSEKRKFG
jgi:hypothetical protein